MAKILTVLSMTVVLMAILVSAGGRCSNSSNSDELSSAVKVMVMAKAAAVVTEGNHSYIRLDLAGGPDKHANTILAVLAVFEANHPELEIVDWKPNAAYLTTHGYGGKVYGIWIDHRKKLNPEQSGQ